MNPDVAIPTMPHCRSMQDCFSAGSSAGSRADRSFWCFLSKSSIGCRNGSVERGRWFREQADEHQKPWHRNAVATGEIAPLTSLHVLDPPAARTPALTNRPCRNCIHHHRRGRSSVFAFPICATFRWKECFSTRKSTSNKCPLPPDRAQT